MLYWHDHGMGGWGWFAMTVGMVLFWVLLIIVVVLLFRAFGRSRPVGGGPPGAPGWPGPGSSSAERILAERYARGEIDDDEYRRRLATLRGSPPGSAEP
ncbi:SHOCT domain-containing protein [Streptomyces sp. NPDC057543]|uniref:SHOCT domain-containing protein n=1 Tax=Streptomyces sp. NPDC057543 TaxID=3346163 RepID=UPI00368FC2EC